ncbi:MAG TPA: bifunctional 4-hydroxy-2-oxoglutarate aldolase/2-dehydro-3-deoxy-phosphogluconate aldolase [Candidatus Limnocylindrales bacterium]|nr:bifunctional 4-hydroxy-2-oxoglutarate aldolase/2-dehydro-3-deoxy-phosphogluconate aldolase [Candidatus Limnocylindrales bacterium]
MTREGLVAVLRGTFPPEAALRSAEALISAGISSIELTTNSQQPFEAMQAIKRAFDLDAAVGMGTVLNAAMAAQALDAGADFLVSPAFDRGMLAAGKSAGVLAVPGVLTPTEVLEAATAGAALVKVFPVGPMGIDYFKALRAPLDHIPMMANGGTSDANVGDFIRAGALACGMANWLTGDGSWQPAEITRRARLLVDIVGAARRGEPLPQRI